MSIGAFGAFLGGLSQGQQQAAAEAQRQQYLNALLAKQAKVDQDEDTTNQALFRTAVLTDDADSDPGDSGLTGATPPPPLIAPPPMQQASMPGAVPMQPGMGGPPPGMMPPPQGMPPGQPPVPGQASVPNGPPPQMAPQMRAAPQQMPPPMPAQAPPQGGPMPAAIPGSRPMGSPPQGMPMPQAGPPRGAVSAPQAPPQPQTPEQMVAASQARIQQLQQELDTPVAQRLLEDPGVKSARKAMHNFVLELQKNNIGTGPGQQKPDAVQMKELQILHSNVELAATKAGKEITSNVSERVKLAQTLAQTSAQLEHAKMVKDASLAATEERGTAAAAKAAAGGAGGKYGFPAYDSLSEGNKNLVDGYIDELRTNGKFVSGGGYNDPLKRTAIAQFKAMGGSMGDVAANVSEKGADTSGQRAAEGKLAILEPSLNTLKDNSKILLDLAAKYKVGPNVPVNTIANLIAKQSSGDFAAFHTALSAVQRESGRVSEGATGASGTKVASIENAKENLGQDFNMDMLRKSVGVMDQDGSNVIKNYKKQVADYQARLKKVGQGQGGGKSAGGDASGFIGKDGTEYSDADVAHAMQVTGKSRAQLMKDAGVQ